MITVANLTVLAAIAPADRLDGLFLPVAGIGWYEFRSASSAAASDLWVIVPSAGTGRWHLSAVPVARLASRPVALVDGPSVAVDASLSSTFVLVMGAAQPSRLIAAPSNLIAGQDIRIWLVQPAFPPPGGCTITLANIWAPRGGSLTLNPASNGVSLLQGQYLASLNKIQCEIGGW